MSCCLNILTTNLRWHQDTTRSAMSSQATKSCFSSLVMEYKPQFGRLWSYSRQRELFLCLCISGDAKKDERLITGKRVPQNVDLPSPQPKDKKKPYPVSIRIIQRRARTDKKLARMGIEKNLEPPKNGMLVEDLIPLAYDVFGSWKALIKGLEKLLNIIPVYGCRCCSDVFVGPSGHQMRDCIGPGNEKRNGQHEWIKGSINDILIPIESYHLHDPFGRRITHERRFYYDRIPAVVELCIQAGVELPEYPSRRREFPIRMLGKKVIDRGGYVDDPDRCTREQASRLEIDTYGINIEPGSSILPADELRELAEDTLEAWEAIRTGTGKLMKKYTVKACGYCSEVHVGPWGHNTKMCGAFKHQWRDGKHGWQDAVLDEVLPPNYVWHVKDPNGPPMNNALKKFYGKAPAVVEVCSQAGAEVPDRYKPMMRLDIVVPENEEAKFVA